MQNGLSPECIAILQRMTGQQKLRTAFHFIGLQENSKPARSDSNIPIGCQRQVEDQVKQIFLYASF